jgi:hypothetical protein
MIMAASSSATPASADSPPNEYPGSCRRDRKRERADAQPRHNNDQPHATRLAVGRAERGPASDLSRLM